MSPLRLCPHCYQGWFVNEGHTCPVSQAFVDQVRAKADIVRIVSERVQLTPRGSDSYMGRCPFHEENTPSFVVNPAKGFFRCFGCGAGGDVFRFLELLDGISYQQAVDIVAKRYQYLENAPRGDSGS